MQVHTQTGYDKNKEDVKTFWEKNSKLRVFITTDLDYKKCWRESFS